MKSDSRNISIVIPTYNGAQWLPKTIDKILAALKRAQVTTFELLVINDGSTDDTVDVLKDYSKKIKKPIKVVTQKNSGRFAARQRGADTAKYNKLLFVDTRVFIGEGSIAYVLNQQKKDSTRKIWCSHVRVDKVGNIYARFWEAVAFIAWRKYFRKPRDISYGIKEFDNYPKGTTCFFVDKDVLQEANVWFVRNTKDLKVSNDDTLLIRHMAESNSINISPDYWCLYHARGSFIPYIKHVHHRGQVFVDGFLRNDGNRFFVPLLIFLVASIIVPLAIVVYSAYIVYVLLGGVVLWLLELVMTLLLGVPIRDALSLFILSPAFAISYGSGIWRAVLRIYTPKFFSRGD